MPTTTVSERRTDVDALERSYNLRPVTQDPINANTPMGANLVQNGATFRLWAPEAEEVYLVLGDSSIQALRGNPNPQLDPAQKLAQNNVLQGHWAGFVEGVKDGDLYLFYIKGKEDRGLKRDLYARELTRDDYPQCACVVRDPNSYPWHDQGYHPPAFQEQILYQLHVGTFLGSKDPNNQPDTFLDVLDKVEYLADLGINTVQFLPVTEFNVSRSMGYDNSDLFSPEQLYTVPASSPKLNDYLNKANSLLQARGQGKITREVLEKPINQLKALIDILHVYKIAALMDNVYNHISWAVKGQRESIWMYDWRARLDGDANLNSHFTDQTTDWGPTFKLYREEVRQFLIDNATFFGREYHADGIRYDHFRKIIEHNYEQNPWEKSGQTFCKNLTGTVRFQKPAAIQIGEYWPMDPLATEAGPDTDKQRLGLDSIWFDGLRNTVWDVLGAVSSFKKANLDNVRNNLYPPGFPLAWKAVQYIESHDEVKVDEQNENGREIHNKKPRIPRRADPGNTRSWWARSRSRTAAGILLTAPGIPMMFMGEEFFEDKSWSDNPEHFHDSQIWWDGLSLDKHMRDFHFFMRDLIWLRRKHPALRSQKFGEMNGYYVHNDNGIMAYQRWIEGIGRDVVVVVSLNNNTYSEYYLGFPRSGRWREKFNSDMYDSRQDNGGLNPKGAGNGGQIFADGPARDNMPYSAKLVIPANSILVFTQDDGDPV